MPLLSAGQGDLTPLFMCNLLNRLSLCPVKGRTLPEAGATQERTLEAVRCSAWLALSCELCTLSFKTLFGQGVQGISATEH